MKTIKEMSSHDFMDCPMVFHQIWVCPKEAWLVWLAIHSYVEQDHYSIDIHMVYSMCLEMVI